MRDPRFVAMNGLLMYGECKLVDDLPTAATNGRDVLIGRQFIDTLDDETLRFVVLHEYYHVLFMHMITWSHLFKEDAQLANFAADAVINIMLDKTAGSGADGFIRVWKDAILDYQYDGMDTGEVYRALKAQSKQEQQANQRSASGGKAKDFDEHRPANANAEGAEGEALTAAQGEEVRKAVDAAVRQAAIVAGKLGMGMDRSIKDQLEVTVCATWSYRHLLHTFSGSHAAHRANRPSPPASP